MSKTPFQQIKEDIKKLVSEKTKAIHEGPTECWSVRWFAHNGGTYNGNFEQRAEFFQNKPLADLFAQCLKQCAASLEYDVDLHIRVKREG